MFQRHQPYENQMPLPYLYAMLCPSQRCGINNDEYDDNDPPGEIPNCHLGFCPLGFIPTTPFTDQEPRTIAKKLTFPPEDTPVPDNPYAVVAATVHCSVKSSCRS